MTGVFVSALAKRTLPRWRRYLKSTTPSSAAHTLQKHHERQGDGPDARVGLYSGCAYFFFAGGCLATIRLLILS